MATQQSRGMKFGIVDALFAPGIPWDFFWDSLWESYGYNVWIHKNVDDVENLWEISSRND